MQVLDAGTGAGALSLAFADHATNPFCLTGFDVSDVMLQEADLNLREIGVKAELINADVRNLPFADDSFDLILVGHLLEHLVHPVQGIEELVRVLRPGGMLVSCITRQSGMGIFIQWKWRTHGANAERAMGWLQRGGLHGVRALPLYKHGKARGMSRAFLGRKPVFS